MESMNLRFRQIRKAKQLTMEDYGKILGITKSGVSSIESGHRNVNDKHIKFLVSELDVNEDFIRHGTEPMFLEILPEDEYVKAAAGISIGKHPLDLAAQQMIIDYWKLDENSKTAFMNYLTGLLDKIKDRS